MSWKFDNNQPIYLQICNIIKLQIVTGQLKIGERLPSVRDLAEIAGVNPNTIQRALSDLENQGFVYSKRTSGRFVTDNQELITVTRHTLAHQELQNFVTNMQNLGFKNDEIVPELEIFLGGNSNDSATR
ncbi:GntR family transcriptional regulator [Streptococcus merionis]|uniref:Transcriptional regulator n=1 Tax=Streptococcus merionis TaxID=400065 RepID=A0A239SQW6_9STRE|nr:GntR family transcriptional regulator [Streptococcus merionis]SNU87797.1 transcriptional regulator [Streptococcus merionis]